MFFIQYIQKSLRKVAPPHSTEDAKRYRLLGELEDQMARNHFYALVNLTDEVMGTGQIEIPWRSSSQERKF